MNWDLKHHKMRHALEMGQHSMVSKGFYDFCISPLVEGVKPEINKPFSYLKRQSSPVSVSVSLLLLLISLWVYNMWRRTILNKIRQSSISWMIFRGVHTDDRHTEISVLSAKAIQSKIINITTFICFLIFALFSIFVKKQSCILKTNLGILNCFISSPRNKVSKLIKPFLNFYLYFDCQKHAPHRETIT